MSVPAAILAAGASTRLGQPKQLVRFDGECLLERAVRVAFEAGCAPILVVLGASAEKIRLACSLPHATIVINEAWQTGMASSIRAALLALPALDEGLLLMACDQPAVTSTHLRRLIDSSHHRAGDSEGPPVATGSRYAGRIGIPAYLPASQRQQILLLQGDHGARELLSTARSIDLPGGELDIDTPASLQQARDRFELVPRPPSA